MPCFNGKLIITSALLLCFVGLPALAESAKATDPANVTYRKRKVWKEVPQNSKIVGSRSLSVTTGWRKIHGWEQEVIEKDPNLNHWSWLAMQEMNKGYKRFAPGKDPLGHKSVRKYKKPIHIQTPVKVQVVRQSQPREHVSVYTRPIHVPLPSVTRTGVSARVRAPRTEVSLAAPRSSGRLSAPRTNLQFSVPRTNGQIATKRTDLRFAVPQTSVQLSVPSTAASLAAPNTAIALRARSTTATLKKSAPETGDFGGSQNGYDEDSFSSPEEFGTNPYGVSRHGSPKTSSTGYVRGKVLRKKPM